jgi:hypothetical protein
VQGSEPIVDMASTVRNISFGGSAVMLRLESPLVVYFDPLALGLIAERFTHLSGSIQGSIDELVASVNDDGADIAYQEVAAFRPGFYTLDPRDIAKLNELDLDELSSSAVLQPAIRDPSFQNGARSQSFQPFHDGDDFAAFDHHANGAPVRVFQRTHCR